MIKFRSLRLALWVCLLPTFSLAATIPEPEVYYRFECPDQLWLDYSNDDFDQAITNPGPSTSTLWTDRAGLNGPVGNYFKRDVPNVFSHRSINTNRFPNVVDPDNFTVELLWNAGHRSTSGSVFAFEKRILWYMYADRMLIRTYSSPTSYTNHSIWLDDLDLLDHEYYFDNDWHHLALVYRNGNEIQIYVDGRTDPQLIISVSQLNSSNLEFLTLNTSDTRPFSIDEVAIYDLALSEDQIATHHQNFSDGEPYCYSNCTLSAVGSFNTYPTARNVEEFPIGYDINNPPAALNDLAGIKNMIEQLTNFPTPRFNPQNPVPKNHPFPGLIIDNLDAYNSSIPEEDGYDAASIPEYYEEIARYFNSTYTFSSSVLVDGDNLNFGSVANNLNGIAKALADHVMTPATAGDGLEYSVVTNWNQVKSYNNTISNINRDNLSAAHYNTVDVFTGTGTQPTYLTFFHSVGEMVGRTAGCFAPGAAISFEAPIGSGNIFEADGAWNGDDIDDCESYTGRTIDFLLENGEEAPYLLGYDDGEQLRGLSSMDRTYAASCVLDNSTFTAKNNTIDTEYAAYLTSNSLPDNADNWRKYITERKKGLRQQYNNGMRNGNNGRSIWWYDVSGSTHWDFEKMSGITEMGTSFSSQSGQSTYSSVYIYPQTPGLWFLGAGATTGWRALAVARQKDLALSTPLEYYAPAISPGFRDGASYSVSDFDMLRPAQYLGLLKAMVVTGAEYFVTFQNNVSGNNVFHNPRLWGWLHTTPGYAQEMISRVPDLYYNSDLMEADQGAINPDGLLGNGPQYRFWSGKRNHLVVARKGDLVSNQDQYLITGAIMNYLPNNLYTSTDPSREEFTPDLAEIQLDPQTPLQFWIRKQGSTYFFDNSNSSDPIFYQLDAWHEHSHPQRWTHDFEFEAEVADLREYVGGNSANPRMEIKTRGMDNQPITDGDFRYFTSYLTFTTSASWTTGNEPYAEYGFDIRNTTTQASKQLWVRARTQGSSTDLDADVRNGSGPVGSTLSSSAITSTCWEWINLGTVNFSTRGNHILRLTPGNDQLEIDQVKLVDSYTAPSFSTPTATLISPSSSVTHYCNGGPTEFVIEFTGEAPFGLGYSVNGNPTQYENNIFPDGNGEYSIWADLSGNPSTFTLVEVSDINCVDGTVTGSGSYSEVGSPTPSITPGGPEVFCPSSSILLDAGYDPSGIGWDYLWSDGVTTQTDAAAITGVYQVTVTDYFGCKGVSQCVKVNVLAPWITYTNSLDACNGGTTLEAHIAACNSCTYQWYMNGSALTGETNSTLLVDGSLVSSGSSASFYVEITENGCTTQSTAVTIPNSISGCPNKTGNVPPSVSLVSEPALSLYPNPNHGSFTFEGYFPDEISLELSLYSLQGTVLKEWEKQPASGTFKKEMHLNELSRGMYFFQVRYGTEIRQFRIVIN